jgi:protein gp37
MNAEWMYDIQQQCQDVRVPFFFKQWGGYPKKKAGRLLSGKEYNEMPIPR